MIADNELDFHVSYENKDEMGTLCNEFEMMRSDLADNNRKMWRMIDDEKALRNAIAHDIRCLLYTSHYIKISKDAFTHLRAKRERWDI